MEVIEDFGTPNLDNVIMHGPLGKKTEGTLCITSHHILLSSRTERIEELWMLTTNVDTVERKLNGITGGSVILKCKDFRVIQLDISPLEAFNNVATAIEALSSINDQTKFHPFFFRPNYQIMEDGWTVFRPELEFNKLLQGDEWRITYINSDFQICPTYPRAVIVPKNVDDDTIITAAKFREGGRFPVLSYRHEGGVLTCFPRKKAVFFKHLQVFSVKCLNNCALLDEVVLMRSSQPLTGPSSRRCKEDERLINSVLGPGKRGYIVDTRTQAVAQAAKSRGGGFEVEIHYPQWRRVSKPIERFTALLDSLTRLIEACNDTSLSMDRWLSRLESSNWMTHVRDVLNCACLVAQCLERESTSVLVHGSEGLDATLLITSLTQIILNPDCRTVRGLQALVEREWLQAGHPFPRRHSHSVYSPSRTKQNAPTFLLFLDCIFQIQIQFPCSFEFSSSLLVQLFEHSYSSKFGTFLGNCEEERDKFLLAKKTSSLWSYLNRPEELQKYLNPLYEPSERIIWPTVAPVSLNFWEEMYLRWVIDQSERECAWRKITQLRDKDKDLRMKATRLRRQLAELEREAIQAGLLAAPSM